MGYPRENTIQTGIASTANTAVTLKLPNISTGSLGTQTGAPQPIGTSSRWRIRSLVASFGGGTPPTTPLSLTITDGHFTYVFDVAGPLVLNPIDWQCAGGAEVDFTLAAGGAGLIGHINVSAVAEG